MVAAILSWLAKQILQSLLKGAVVEAASALAQVRKDEERGETNEENVQRYRESTTRAERIRAAADLLNGTRSP